MSAKLVFAAFSALLLPFAAPPHGGPFMPTPALAASRPTPLSHGARALVERAFADLDGRSPLDCHVHILGLGGCGTGVWANPKLLSWSAPYSHIKARMVLASSGVKQFGQADAQYLDRLIALARQFPVPPKLAILAFDYRYAKDGVRDLAASEFHIPNEYVLDLAGRCPDLFIPVVSVHPYAPDALDRLEECSRRGARLVKWLPNTQGMDPFSPGLDDFYRLMARHSMALLCHTGREASVGKADQRLGNPLLLRRALDMGVTVIMAHAGNHGSSDDLENPGRRASNFELFLRMMDDPRYQDRLYGDISMIAQTIRSRHDLRVLLEREDLHPRLINGSDYPLPAVDAFVQPRLLKWAGFITGEERRHLSEIYKANPLLFDFVLKRVLRHPETGVRFPASVFATRRDIPAFAQAATPTGGRAQAGHGAGRPESGQAATPTGGGS